MESNFTKKLDEISKLLNSWMYRHLTPFGKICVIKSLALSKLSHLVLVIPSLNKQRLKTLNTVLFRFLWNNKPDKVNRKDAVKPVKYGGLGMVEVETFWKALKFSWCRRLLVTDDILGLSGFYPKFVKKYVNLNTVIEKAVKKYSKEVKNKVFPKNTNFLYGK